VILSGLEILFDANLPTARSSCCLIMMELSDMGSGYIYITMMSEMSVNDSDENAERRISLN